MYKFPVLSGGHMRIRYTYEAIPFVKFDVYCIGLFEEC